MNRILLLFVSLLPVFGYANTYNVTDPSDGMALNQLRGALADADAHGGANTINLSAGTYALSGAIIFGALPGENLTITGAGVGSTIIEMTTQDRIFIVNTSGAVTNLTVTISKITFTGGEGATDADGGGAILCGGPGNVTTITNCAFTNNVSNISSGGNPFPDSGGAIAQESGGTFVVSNCTFTNNSVWDGTGGAIFYFQPNTQPGSIAVTNCTFSGNAVSATGTFGGALYIDIQGTTLATSVSVTGNTFVGNSAPASGAGGAIDINNGSTATAVINYNRFNKNSGTFPDVSANSSKGPIDITNNWWGRNVSPVGATDPHAGIVGTGGTTTLLASAWLELTLNGASSSVCYGTGGGTTVTASFLKNSSGSAVAVGNLGALIGLPVSFGGTSMAVGSTQGTVQSSGTETADIIAAASSGTAVVQAIADSVPPTDVTAETLLTIAAASGLPAASVAGSGSGASTEPVTDASCHAICVVAPSGASPVSGTFAASVTIDPSVQSADGQPYVARHYDITPASGASTATAMITLYFLQSEFNAYNAVVNNPAIELPTSSSDATGMANLTITQFHGSGTAPGNYSGWTGPGPASVLISPGSSNVVWNNAKSWWEVSFPVTGFSGFYVTGAISVPLPVVLERFSGMLQGTGVLLNWTVGVEQGMSRYEVQGSVDGVAFSSLGVVAARDGANAVTASGADAATTGGADAGDAYQYFVGDPSVGANYYRLKMVNTDGTFAYSTVVVVNVTEGGHGVRVLSNPFTTSCTVQVTVLNGGPVNLRMTDLSGKVLWSAGLTLVAGVNTFTLPRTDGLARGMYLLSVMGGQVQETVKVVKE